MKLLRILATLAAVVMLVCPEQALAQVKHIPKCTIAAGSDQVKTEGGTCGWGNTPADGDLVVLTDANSTDDCGSACGGTPGGGGESSICAYNSGVSCLRPLAGANTREVACATGVVKGAGYDSDTGLYDWTCGNYNWSAEVGGYPDYDTATTTGGNSWTMACTGDGTATGTPDEDNICLASGESIRMYAMADIMLAMDNTRTGGEVYLPAGLYQDGGCGQSSAGAANGCPWLQHDYTHEQQAVQMYRNIALIGAGAQLSDPAIYGRDPSNSFLIQDRGQGKPVSECTGSGTPVSCCTGVGTGTCVDSDVGGSGGVFGRWNNLAGMYYIPRQCKTDQDSPATVVCLNNTDVLGKVGFSRYGRNGSLLSSATINTSNGICVDNTVDGTHGVCENDPRIICTTNDGDRPPAGNSGDCDVVGGNCVGYADMIDADLTAGKDVYAVINIGSCSWGDTGGAECASGSANAALGRITAIGAACGAGKYAEFEAAYNNSNDRMWPLPAYIYDTTDKAGTINVVDMDEYFNAAGGFRDLTFMQGEWSGRSPCTDGTQPTCNDGEIISMGMAYEGGFDNIAIWYSGVLTANFGYSAVDGMAQGSFRTHLRDSLISQVRGILSDASGWTFERNTWLDNNCGSNYCIKTTYGNGMWMGGDRFVRNYSGVALVGFNFNRGSSFRDLEFISNQTLYGLFRNEYSAHVMVDGIRGYGNKGPVYVFAPHDNYTVWGNTVRNVNLTAQDLLPPDGNPMFPCAFAFTDFDGNASYNAGLLKEITLDNITIDAGDTIAATTANYCLFAFGGGFGDEQAHGQDVAANGSGRVIEYQRDQVSISNASLNSFGHGSACPFILGNVSASENDCYDKIADIWDSASGMPSWSNVSVYSSCTDLRDDDSTPDGNACDTLPQTTGSPDGRCDLTCVPKYAGKIPDHPTVVTAADNTDEGPHDCDVLAKHTKVWIYDDPTAVGTCDDTDANGALEGGAAAGARYTSCCVCDGAGTWSECSP